MDSRTLTTKELDKLTAAGKTDLELVAGQDHDWWIYSNTLDAYWCTNIPVRKLTIQELRTLVWTDKRYLQPNNIWYFGDDFDI